MVDSSNKKKRKELISEGDIATLLQRYDAITILKLLQEMAYYAKPKMDWNELVKKTTTGITNAREYQLLWRHLAYRDSLSLLPDAPLQDDDSDMECELEASPSVSIDSAVEAVAHVKVIAASYVPSESDIPEDSTVEAPLTINVPYGLHRGPQEPSDSYWSSRGMNITFPVLLQKAAEGYNGNGLASSMAPRKRRKKWSTEDDDELIAAVKRHGEGSWALIAKEEFEGERTASQLSQRWGAIRRRCDNSNSSTQSGLQRTEAQMAANRALSLAVGNRLPSKKLGVGIPGRITGPQANGSNSGSSVQGNQQSQPVVQALPRAATPAPATKSRVTGKKTIANSTLRAELMVTANSVAAAACMSGLTTAALVPKVEPGKNAVTMLVPKVEPVKNVSAASLPRSSSLESVPNSEPVKRVAAAAAAAATTTASTATPHAATAATTKAVEPSNIRHSVDGIPKHSVISSAPSSNKQSPMAPLTKGSTIQNKSVPSGFASSRLAPTQRVPAPIVMPQKPSAAAAASMSCKPVGVQKEQTQGNRASPMVTTIVQPNKTISTNSATSAGKLVAAKLETPPSLMPKKNQIFQTEIGRCTVKSPLDKAPEKESSTTVSPLTGAEAESKPKNEASKGKTHDLATAGSTVQKGL